MNVREAISWVWSAQQCNSVCTQNQYGKWRGSAALWCGRHCAVGPRKRRSVRRILSSSPAVSVRIHNMQTKEKRKIKIRKHVMLLDGIPQDRLQWGVFSCSLKLSSAVDSSVPPYQHQQYWFSASSAPSILSTASDLCGRILITFLVIIPIASHHEQAANHLCYRTTSLSDLLPPLWHCTELFQMLSHM